MVHPSPLLVSLFACTAPPVVAHPHVFVDATVEVLTEAGAVTGVRLTWTYDDFFSLMLTEDLGIDGDGDLILTDAEESRLDASLSEWPPDFTGDLVISSGAGDLPLSPRKDHDALFTEGRVVEAHTRPLASPAAATGEAVMIALFDPFYYVAYEVMAATVSGDPSCRATVIPADLIAAQAEVDATWEGLDWAGASPDEQLPPIGEAFADRVEVRCGG